MSNIIKSSRIIESLPSKKTKDQKNPIENKLNESLLEKGRMEYKDLLKEARLEASKIVEKAEEQQESMLNAAYNKAREVLEESKESGYNKGYEIGHEEGFQKGYQEGKLVSDSLIKDSLELKEQYINNKKKLLDELEADVIELVIEIYEKIINKKIAEDREVVISLVLKGISSLDLTDKLTIIVSKDDYNILEMNRDEILSKASMISELEIKYDMSFEKGECILETSKGNIDASLNNQLEEVRELLTNILNNE